MPGRFGIRQVDLGQYLTAGTTVVTLQALDPILVDFYVPQQALAHMKIGQTVDGDGRHLSGQQTFSGAIESINSKVDTASRNVQVRASFHNADRRLVPGMFANVRIESGEATTPDHAAANGDHLQPLRRHGLSSCRKTASTTRASRS